MKEVCNGGRKRGIMEEVKDEKERKNERQRYMLMKRNHTLIIKFNFINQINIKQANLILF